MRLPKIAFLIFCLGCSKNPEIIGALSLGSVCDVQAVNDLWSQARPNEQLVRAAITKRCLAQVMLEDLRLAHGRLVAEVGRKVLAEAIAANRWDESTLESTFMLMGLTAMACDDLKLLSAGKLPITKKIGQPIDREGLVALCNLRPAVHTALDQQRR